MKLPERFITLYSDMEDLQAVAEKITADKLKAGEKEINIFIQWEDSIDDIEVLEEDLDVVIWFENLEVENGTLVRIYVQPEYAEALREYLILN